MKCVISDPQRINLFHRSIQKLGKINEDVVFCASEDFVTIFTSNVTRSVRPVIRYKPSFFSQYEYTHDSQNLIYQITVKSITDALKDLSSPEYLGLEVDATKSTLIMSAADKFKIIHKFNLYLQEAVTQSGDIFENVLYQTAKVTINFDALKEMENAFKKTNNMMLGIIQRGEVYYIRFIPDDDDVICHSDLKIRNNPTCRIEVSDPSVYPLTFYYSDFKHVLKISSSFGNKFELFTSLPGSPLVIRANFLNCAEIESALATMLNNDVTKESTQEIVAQEAVAKQQSMPKPPPVPEYPKILGDSDNEESKEKKEEEKKDSTKKLPPPEPPRIPLPIQMSQSQEEWSQSQSSNQSQTSFHGTQVVPWPGFIDTNSKPARRKIMSISASQSEGSTLSQSEE